VNVNALPGVNRDNLLNVLVRIATDAGNLRGRSGTPEDNLIAYLNWAAQTCSVLRTYLRREDIQRTILTDRYHALLAAAGAARFMPSVVNGLLALELDACAEALQGAVDTVRRQIKRWDETVMFVVADANFFLHNSQHLGHIRFHEEILNSDSEHSQRLASAANTLHLLIPSRVIFELDKAKMHNNDDTRSRARTTLKKIDAWFENPAVPHHEPTRTLEGWHLPAQFRAELLIDPVEHSPLPAGDAEIIDRVLAVQPMTGRPITIITFDTNMSTQARIAGVPVLKLDQPSMPGKRR
jgi:rRNA-processing protein FCF1